MPETQTGLMWARRKKSETNLWGKLRGKGGSQGWLTGANAGGQACTIHKLTDWEKRGAIGGGYKERVAHASFAIIIKYSSLTLEQVHFKGDQRRIFAQATMTKLAEHFPH